MPGLSSLLSKTYANPRLPPTTFLSKSNKIKACDNYSLFPCIQTFFSDEIPFCAVKIVLKKGHTMFTAKALREAARLYGLENLQHLENFSIKKVDTIDGYPVMDLSFNDSWGNDYNIQGYRGNFVCRIAKGRQYNSIEDAPISLQAGNASEAIWHIVENFTSLRAAHLAQEEKAAKPKIFRLDEDGIVKAVQDWLVTADGDEIARVAGEIFGGECYCVGDEYLFEIDQENEYASVLDEVRKTIADNTDMTVKQTTIFDYMQNGSAQEEQKRQAGRKMKR